MPRGMTSGAAIPVCLWAVEVVGRRPRTGRMGGAGRQPRLDRAAATIGEGETAVAMTAQQDSHDLHDLKLRLHYLMRDAHKSDMEDVVILIAAAETAVDEALARRQGINEF